MFVILLFIVPVLEIVAFVEVAEAIGWLLAVVLLFATSLIGARMLRVQGRAAIDRVTVAISERRRPGRAAIDGLLGVLGAALLFVPGFLTDALGALLLVPQARRMISRWVSAHYGGLMVSVLATSGRFAAGVGRRPPADVESTAIDDDTGQLER